MQRSIIVMQKATRHVCGAEQFLTIRVLEQLTELTELTEYFPVFDCANDQIL